MTGMVLATAASHVDVVARGLAIGGLAVAVLSVAFNGYQWHRSGPALKVEVYRRPITRDSWAIEGATISNRGRMPVVVQSAVIMPAALRLPKGRNIWGLEPIEGEFPITIPPTGSCRVAFSLDYEPPVGTVVRAWASRGDGRSFRSGRARASGSRFLPYMGLDRRDRDPGSRNGGQGGGRGQRPD